MKKGWYILLYHNVSWEENPYVRGIGGTCPPDIFRDHVIHLHKAGEFVSIPEGLSRLSRGDVTRPMFSFWFDDGLTGPRQYVLPLLKQYNTTGALSICSRFVNRSEFFWRFKLSYLNYVDGLRFLRVRLRKCGYEHGRSVKDFCYDNFSESIVKEIDNVFRMFASEAEQKDAFRLFETDSGLLELKRESWTLTNHTAAHYPVGEDTYFDNFYHQYTECENKFKELFNEESQFWVLPFGNVGTRASKLVEAFGQRNDGKYMGLVDNKINNYTNIERKTLNRIIAPLRSGSHLLKFLGRL